MLIFVTALHSLSVNSPDQTDACSVVVSTFSRLAVANLPAKSF